MDTKTRPATVPPQQLDEKLDEKLDMSSVDDPSVALSAVLPDRDEDSATIELSILNAEQEAGYEQPRIHLLLVPR